MILETTLTPGKTDQHPATGFARHLPTIGRVLMGLMFTVFGLFGLLTYFHVVPQPSGPMSAAAKDFADALTKTGYMVPLSSGTQLVVGLLLLTNRFVPLALTLIAPVIVNIFLFHAFLAPDGLVIPIVLAALEIALAWAYRDAFRPMLAIRTVPTGKENR